MTKSGRYVAHAGLHDHLGVAYCIPLLVGARGQEQSTKRHYHPNCSFLHTIFLFIVQTYAFLRPTQCGNARFLLILYPHYDEKPQLTA